MSEQYYINLFFNHMQNYKASPNSSTETPLKKIIVDIDKKFPKSPILQYYLGFYYDEIHNTELAIKKFTKCIQLLPFFSQPYLHLSNIYMSNNQHDKALPFLQDIFRKRTIDMKSGSLKRIINLPEQMQIGVMLQTIHEKNGDNDKSLNVLNSMLHFLTTHSPSMTDPFYVLWFKQISLSLANACSNIDPQQSFEHLLKAICTECQTECPPTISAINKNLLSKLLVHMHYADHSLFGNPANALDIKTFKTIQTTTAQTYTPHVIPKFPLPKNNGKINIGYLSPDFNKNAVGLFLTCFLKHYNHSQFNVFVYYTNHQSDEFTTVFKNYPKVIWTEVAHMDDSSLYNLIKFKHRIDVLVDLISAGVSNKLELMSMSPANVIINYLGYPGTSFIPQVTHKLTDAISDPLESHKSHYTEKLIRMPRCFLCFSLFENLPNIPPINPTFDSQNTIYAGVMNKSLKFHPNILKAWKEILSSNKNLVLCIKQDEPSSLASNLSDFIDSVPSNQIKIIPFQPSLPEYLNVFNRFHFCLDTFPYSGTTTTCTSLYMGVPVFTIYNPRNMHVSNVSTSVIKGTDPTLVQTFVCNDFPDYVSRVNDFCSLLLNNPDSHSWNKRWRQDLQTKFLQLMEPQRFMREYENVIKNLL